MGGPDSIAEIAAGPSETTIRIKIDRRPQGSGNTHGATTAMGESDSLEVWKKSQQSIRYQLEFRVTEIKGLDFRSIVVTTAAAERDSPVSRQLPVGDHPVDDPETQAFV
jgi:hypothetical protein